MVLKKRLTTLGSLIKRPTGMEDRSLRLLQRLTVRQQRRRRMLTRGTLIRRRLMRHGAW